MRKLLEDLEEKRVYNKNSKDFLVGDKGLYSKPYRKFFSLFQKRHVMILYFGRLYA